MLQQQTAQLNFVESLIKTLQDADTFQAALQSSLQFLSSEIPSECMSLFIEQQGHTSELATLIKENASKCPDRRIAATASSLPEEQLHLVAQRSVYSYTDQERAELNSAAYLLAVHRREHILNKRLDWHRQELEKTGAQLCAAREKSDIWENRYHSLARYSEGLTRLLFRSHRQVEAKLNSLVQHKPELRKQLEPLRQCLAQKQRESQDVVNHSALGGRRKSSERVNLNQQLARALADLRQLQEEKGWNFERPRLPVIQGDPECWHTLFVLLLENCLTHGAAKPNVRLALTEDMDHYHFTLSNNGAALPRKWKSEVFQPFVKAPGPDASERLGLGLYTARSIVLEFGGRMWFGDEPEAGGVVLHWTVPR